MSHRYGFFGSGHFAVGLDGNTSRPPRSSEALERIDGDPRQRSLLRHARLCVRHRDEWRRSIEVNFAPAAVEQLAQAQRGVGPPFP
jgi:hypothetical protein